MQKNTKKPDIHNTKATKLKLVPLYDRVVLRLVTGNEAKTSFGLLIPDAAKEKPEQGIVVAIGEGRRLENGSLAPLSVKVDDQVVFSKYGYDEVKLNGETFYILPEQQILAVIK